MLNYRRILKYLFIPGLILAVAGLIAGLTTKTWSPLYVGLVIAGSILLIVWLLYLLITGRSFWKKRSTQAGTNALISTVSLIVILGLINFVAVRYSTPIDLTENQLYTLSPESQEIVENLKDPLKVWLFVKDPSPRDRDLLENYRRYNDKFEFEFVDPDTNIGLTKRFNVQSLGDVYVEYGDKKQLSQTLIAFNAPEPLSEIKLTNAIEKIQRDYTPTVYFLQGHGEYALDSSQEGNIATAVDSLKNKGYRVEPLELANLPQVPDDANAVIIAGPQRELFEQEVAALKAYSNQGGNLLLLLNPAIETGLEPFLEDWGVSLDNRIVIDGSGQGNMVGLGPATPLITSYGNHPITKEFGNSISFYPLARPVDTIETPNVEATSLLVVGEQTWAESDLESEELTFDETQDIPGPFDIGVALTRQINPKEKPQPSPSPSQPTQPTPTPSPTENQETETESPETEETQTPSPFPNPPEATPTPSPQPSPSPTIDPLLTPKSPTPPPEETEITPTPSPQQTPTPSPSPQKTPTPSPSSSNSKIRLVSNVMTVQNTETPSPSPTLEEKDPDSTDEEKPNQPESKPLESRMVVIGNSAFITENLFNQQLNGDVFLNSVQWLVNQDNQPLSIRPKEPENRRINLTPLQGGLLTFLSLVFFPLLGLFAAVVTWWRRR